MENKTVSTQDLLIYILRECGPFTLNLQDFLEQCSIPGDWSIVMVPEGDDILVSVEPYREEHDDTSINA